MAEEVVMPRLSDSMEEGTILKWIKSEGDEVAIGDELVEIETDKANMVYEADAAGTLVEIVAQEGDTLPIGEVIARVGEAGEATGDGGAKREEKKGEEEPESGDEPDRADDGGGGGEGAQPERAAAATAERAEAERPAAEDARAAAGDGRIKASPIARRIASERGLDLAAIEGSGPGGRIVKADVEKAATKPEPKAPEPAPERAAEPEREKAAPTPGAREKPETAKGETEVVELTKLQQTVARRMAESKATAPHFYLEAEVDMTKAVEARRRLKEMAGEGEPVPTFNDMIVKACALALRDFPRANGAYRDGRVEQYARVNVGVAVAGRDALVVPTVFDADRKGLRQIATETRALAARVRDATITPPELSGGTFTVSNLGMFGISSFAAVINPPQAAILAVGELKATPVFDDAGEIARREVMKANLACDHRILYGADGARFLGRIRELLEEPVSLAL